tara:strand:- start:1499 stop:2245 length:747 start_codon:yes stop_codon:yes gene_type:complete
MNKTQISVKGSVAFVSGANRGIGKAIVEEFMAQDIKKVYAGARNISSLQALKEKYGDRLVAVELDVTKDDTIKAASALAKDVNILINNAGVLLPDSFLNGNILDNITHHFNVNVFGLVKLTHSFLPTIQAQNAGAIASVSSVAGLANMPMINSYSASKAAVHSLIQGLRGELKDSAILVSGIYPGPIETDMTDGFEMDMDSPENVAKNVVNGIQEGVEDIFPDTMSAQIKVAYASSPKAIEEQFSNFK